MNNDDKETENRGLSVIRYRWDKMKTAFDASTLLKGILRFFLHFLAFVVVLPFAGLYALPEHFIPNLKKELREAVNDITHSSETKRKIDFVDFLATSLMVVLNFIFLVLLYAFEVPFLILYWTYQFLEKLCSYTLIKWLIVLLVTCAVIYGCFKLVTSLIGQPT